MNLRALLTAAAVATAALAVIPAQAVTLRWAAQNDILSLDPHSQNHATTNAILMHAYEGLTRYDAKYQVEPSEAAYQSAAPAPTNTVIRFRTSGRTDRRPRTQKAMPIDVWVAAHGSQYQLHEKWKPGQPYSPDTFVDPEGLRAAVDRLEAAYVKYVAEERAAAN